jgi:DNA-binding transcriptional regulator of glucitol operon
VFLHVGGLLFVPFCILATWWQITRAEDGNGLSYLYTFEWPVFAIVGVYFWWQFLHTDYEAVGLRGMRNQSAAQVTEAASEAATPVGSAVPAQPVPMQPVPAPLHAVEPVRLAQGPQADQDDEDPELAAYNARLAALATSGGKTWRKPEAHVARRPR